MELTFRLCKDKRIFFFGRLLEIGLHKQRGYYDVPVECVSVFCSTFIKYISWKIRSLLRTIAGSLKPYTNHGEFPSRCTSRTHIIIADS